MNSYGSVSLVSQAIYRFIHYMNWMDDAVTDPTDAVTDPTDAVTDPTQMINTIPKPWN